MKKTLVLLIIALIFISCTRETRKGPPICGDGVVQAGIEGCDDGNAITTDACPNCMPASCGDGYIWEGKEECDDGNTQSDDGCSKKCLKE
jgi:cysteine-rich repeat protein